MPQKKVVAYNSALGEAISVVFYCNENGGKTNIRVLSRFVKALAIFLNRSVTGMTEILKLSSKVRL